MNAYVPILRSSGRAGGRRWLLRATPHGMDDRISLLHSLIRR